MTLKKNEQAVITTKTAAHANQLLLEDRTKFATYHSVVYREDGSIYEQRANGKITAILGDVVRMASGGSAVVENVGKSPLSVYGASRIYTMKKTQTPPFRTIRIQPNERATIHTTEALGNAGFGTILVDDQVAEGFYHYSSYWKKGILLYEQGFNKSTKQFILNNIRYRDEGQIVVENIGKTPIILYATERYTTYAIMPITEKE